MVKIIRILGFSLLLVGLHDFYFAYTINSFPLMLIPIFVGVWIFIQPVDFTGYRRRKVTAMLYENLLKMGK